ncbi:MAG: tetratricopeptide repeat protein [Fulvivirga sp.]
MNQIKFLQLLALTILLSKNAVAIPNCYIYKEDEKCYEACKEAEKAIQHAQGSKASQEHFLKSIELCPEFAYSFFEQSVPFAKRGQMNLWIGLINKAVDLDPEQYLGQRGWYHWFFMHNYDKAISDIDKLDDLLDYDIGETGDGFYHLNIMKGLCYKGLGDYEKAIELIENCINSEDYYQGSYDNLHLGVLYLEVNEPEKALVEFEKQMEYNDISEAYFYSAKAYQQLGNSKRTIEYLNLSLEKYDQSIAMHNPYRQLMDEIYRLDIEEEIESVANK